ncbi:MAG: hypothetical protein P9L92_14765 [Candidatus Electryonea clarkiae]|nr:hypothetical protein [Candidatus Electryonea clarkiae]MDP8288303.1 hypothetical protein [Candidatus Electryonea clarkiae]
MKNLSVELISKGNRDYLFASGSSDSTCQGKAWRNADRFPAMTIKGFFNALDNTVNYYFDELKMEVLQESGGPR